MHHRASVTNVRRARNGLGWRRARCESLEPVETIEPERVARLRGLFVDLDETISTEGKLTAEAYGALWRLAEAGLEVVLVTGRPAGWCDHLARFWPVRAVIGENGGFYFHHDGRRLNRRFLHDEAERAEFRKRLEAIGKEILDQVPGAAPASDQPYREYDLAIDYCEDVEPLGPDAAEKIKALFESAGARAKISSIHVNGWFGDFDKLTTARLCAAELLGLDLNAHREAFAFCGDSPNDEPMFGFFPLSFAVANVRPFLPTMKHRPAYITQAAAGAGFAELARLIVSHRQAA